MLSLEGKQLGNYDVTRRIRVGGMGAVYEGRQRTAFGRRVAIKVILGDFATDPDMRRRFAREAKTIARLQHPHILQLIEFGDAQGILYLVMPFIDGGTLTNYLRHNLPELGEVASIYGQLLDAVEYAHEQSFIHRDIKSSNVLLELRKNAPPYVYLADFGLVRTIRPTDNTQVGKPIPLEQVPGTPHYMAPEQTMGIVTPLTDIYALGVLLYQMLTGNLPYNDPDEVAVIKMHMQAPIPVPSDYDPSIPYELDEVVHTAMAKKPEDRYRTVSELRDAFQRALKGPSNPLHITPVLPTLPDSLIDAPEPSPLPQPMPQSVRRHNATPRRPLEPPRPIVMNNQRVRNETPRVATRETRDLREQADYSRPPERPVRPRTTTETVVRPRLRPVTTEEPFARGRKKYFFPLIAAIVCILLIALLLAPRVFGASILPVNIPLLGSPSGATVSITAQSQTLQKTFLLTASPDTTKPDVKLQKIPDRVIKLSQTASSTVSTTGTQQDQGIRSRGRVVITNNSDQPVVLPVGQTFTTTTGQRFQNLAALNIPPKAKSPANSVTAVLEALEPGKKGNIPAFAFNNPCCGNPNVLASNPQAFDGGQDGSSNRFVTQADIDGVKDNLQPKLQQAIQAELKKRLASDEVIAVQPAYKITRLTPDQPINKPADRVKVTLTLEGSVIVYKKKVAEETAMVLLNNQAREKFGADYQLQGPQSLLKQQVEIGKDGKGTVFITITVRGIWAYIFTEERIQKLRDPIKGSTTAVATAYLKTQPGVAQVEIRLPFGTDRLPGDTGDISITVIQPPSSP